jgi:DNA replication protein DnaC
VSQKPKCRVCGAEVEVEGYAELPETYQASIDRMIVCEEHEKAEQERAEQEVLHQRRALYHGAVGDAQLPSKLKGKNWSDLDTEEEDVVEGEKLIATAAQATETRVKAIEACRRWSRGEIAGLILAGRVGMGKSWFAAVAAQALIYERVKVLDAMKLDKPMMPLRWVTVPELIQKARGDFESDRRRDAEKVLDGSFGLVLDDIDKVKPTEFSLDLLFEAIESRINRAKPLLVTTNLGYRELRDLLGDPIASRLRGYCEGHRMIGRDRRR